jgi:hypothetical protein
MLSLLFADKFYKSQIRERSGSHANSDQLRNKPNTQELTVLWRMEHHIEKPTGIGYLRSLLFLC